jgi:hypothetical protein
MTFPCFDGESLWAKLFEIDEVNGESAFVALACNNLQIGTNLLLVEISENSGAM